MTTPLSLHTQLEARRTRLGMSKAQLARRSKISVPTVNRLLEGSGNSPQLDTLAALAVALGVEVRVGDTVYVHERVGAQAFREQQATAKAKRLTRLLQGTMALEAEALGPKALKELQEQNVHVLLAGPPRRLWGD